MRLDIHMINLSTDTDSKGQHTQIERFERHIELLPFQTVQNHLWTDLSKQKD